MRILVVGAGATGGYYGLRLAQAGRDVTFLVRPKRAETLRTRGLRLTGAEGEAQIEPQLVTADELSDPFEIVLMSVKATALDAAIADVAPAVGPETLLVPFLNGMAHLQPLSDRFGADAVLAGVIRVAASLDEQGGVVLRARGASMEAGTQDGSASSQLDEVAAQLSGAGFEFTATPHAVAAMWHKWVFIATIGALTCMMRSPVGDIVACPTGPELGPALLAEAAAVAAAAGYPVPDDQLASTRAAVTQERSRLTSSMYRDMSDGAPTEVEQILGDLVARARALSVATPVLDLATLSLRVYERGRSG